VLAAWCLVAVCAACTADTEGTAGTVTQVREGVALEGFVGAEISITGTYGGPGKIADYVQRDADTWVYLTGSPTGATPAYGDTVTATGTLRYAPGSSGPDDRTGLPARYYVRDARLALPADE